MCIKLPGHPKSDSERLIIPYYDLCRFYNTDNFEQAEFGGRFSRRELDKLICELKRMRSGLANLFFCEYCSVFLLVMFLLVVSAPVLVSYWGSDTRVYFIAFLPPIALAIIACLTCLCIRRADQKIDRQLRDASRGFLTRGVRIVNGKRSRWIEIWMDFKFRQQQPQKSNTAAAVVRV